MTTIFSGISSRPCNRFQTTGTPSGAGIVERMLAAGQDVNHLYHTIPVLVGPDGARWLVAQPASERLVGIVRAFGPPETKDVLRGPITAEQQEQLDQSQREEQQRQERTQQLQSDYRNLGGRRCFVAGTRTGGPSALAGT